MLAGCSHLGSRPSGRRPLPVQISLLCSRHSRLLCIGLDLTVTELGWDVSVAGAAEAGRKEGEGRRMLREGGGIRCGCFCFCLCSCLLFCLIL